MRIADVLTALRIISGPIVAWLILSDRPDAAYHLFAAAAITDYLDGYFARRSKKIVEYGAAFDFLGDLGLIIPTGFALLIRGDGLSLFVIGVITAVLVFPLLGVISRRQGRLAVPHLDTNLLAAFVYTSTMAYIVSWRYALPLLLFAFFAVGMSRLVKLVAYARTVDK